MQTATSTEIQNRFGQYLEASLTEPVIIKKTGRPVAVIISMKEYERFTDMEDAIWAKRAMRAEKSGYLGHKATMKFLQSR